jgi:hypothetical protein
MNTEEHRWIRATEEHGKTQMESGHRGTQKNTDGIGLTEKNTEKHR